MWLKALFTKWRFFGMGREEYVKCLEKTFPDNLFNLYKANLMVAALAFSFTVIRYLINSVDYLTMGVYFGTGLVAVGLIFIVNRKKAQLKKGKSVSRKFIYALIIIYYFNAILFGIYLGVWANPGKIAGAFLGILICALFIFDIPAILNFCLTTAAASLFMIICVIVKTPDNWSIDLSNAVFAAIIGIYFGWQIVRSRINKS